MRFVLILALALGGLSACQNGDRRLSRIPPLPAATDSTQLANTLRALNRAVGQSSSGVAYAKRALVYLALGRLAEAHADADEAVSTNSSTGYFHLVRAQVLRAQNRPVRALEAAQRAEILGVNSPDLFTLMGDVLQQQNLFPKAELYLNKALELAPYDGEAVFYTGLVAAKQGDTLRAVARYERALALKPRFLPTYNQLTAIYRQQRDLATALAYNQRASQFFPVSAELVFQRGMIYQYAGRADSALLAYQKTVALQPNYVEAYFQAGLIFDRLRNYAVALTNFERVKQQQPTHPRVDTYLGHCLEMTYQWDRAAAQYTLALRADPADPAAQAGLWRVQRRQQQQSTNYNDYFLAPTAPETGLLQSQSGGRMPDTSRGRNSPVQPRTRIQSMGDSTFTVKPID